MESNSRLIDAASDGILLSPLQTHSGKPVPDNWDFFAPPPAEIGALISSETTLRIGENEMSSRQFTFWILLLGGTFGLLFCLMDGPSIGIFVTGVLIFTPLAAFFLTVFATFEHHCSYVGQEGIARISFRGSRRGLQKKEMLTFSEAHDSIANYVTNLRFGDKTIEIEWRSANRRRIFKVGVEKSAFDVTRRSRQLSALVATAESAWKNFLLQKVLEKRGAGLSIEFRLKRDDLIVISPGCLSIQQGRHRQEIAEADLKSIRLKNGFFQIVTLEAGFITNKGRTTFRYSDLGNACVFLDVAKIYFPNAA